MLESKSQYGVLDSGVESSRYTGGGMLPGNEDLDSCRGAQYTGAMIPTAQDVTVSTSSQYPGSMLSASAPVPESVVYSASHYSQAVMQGNFFFFLVWFCSFCLYEPLTSVYSLFLTN